MVNRIIEAASKLCYYIVVFLAFTMIGQIFNMMYKDAELVDGIPYVQMGIVIIYILFVHIMEKKRNDGAILQLILFGTGTAGALLSFVILKSFVVPLTLLFIYFWSLMTARTETFSVCSGPDAIRLGIMMVLYIAESLSDLDKQTLLSRYLVLFYIIMMSYYSNHKNLEEYIKNRKESTIIAGNQIKKVAQRLSARYTLALGGILLLMTALFYDDIAMIFKWLVQKIVQLLSQFGEEGLETQPVLPEKTAVSVQMPLGTEQPIATSKPSPVLDKVFTAAVFIACAVLVIAIIVSIVAALRKVRQPEQVEDDLYDTIEIREKMERKKKKKERGIRNQDSRERIRHLYRKQIKGFWKNSGVQPEMTVPEQQRKMKNERGGAISDEMTRMYEKARYSQEEITSEDAKAFRKKK